MSMTADERKGWAHDRLNNYLRDVEIGEFLGELADVSHLEDRVCNLEWSQEENERLLEQADSAVTRLEERLDIVEGELDSLAS